MSGTLKLDHVKSCVEKLLSCCQCDSTDMKDMISYDDCEHMYCQSCSTAFCQKCTTVSTRRPVKEDADLFDLIRVIKGVLDEQYTEPVGDVAIFDGPFQLFKDLIETHEDYIISETILKEGKKRNMFPISYESIQSNKRKSTGNLNGDSKPKQKKFQNGQTPNAKESKTRSTPRRNTKTSANSKSNNSPLLKSAKKINSKGETALHLAIKSGNIDDVTPLLEAGVNVNKTDFAGWTPLHDAVDANMLPAIELLLNAGAIVNAAGPDNKTALHLAVENNKTAIIEVLLSYGADPTAKDLYGQTPRDLFNGELVSPANAKEENEPQGFEEYVVYLHKLRDVGKIPEFIKRFNINISERNIHAATHVIVAKNSNLKDLDWQLAQVIAKGAFILTSRWCDDSLTAGTIKSPEDYEVQPDWMPGLPLARRNALALRPKLLSGISFFIGSGKLRSIRFREMSIDLLDLKNFIQLLGGKILKRSPDPEDIHTPTIFPYHAKYGLLEKCSTIMIDLPPDYNMKPRYAMMHLKVLPVTWLIDSILSFELIDDLNNYSF